MIRGMEVALSSYGLLAYGTFLAMLAKPLHGTILVKVMLTRKVHDDFIRLIL